MPTKTKTATPPDETVGGPFPFLRRVWIRNYKSIAYCDVTLEPLTILIGRNASGKSNFLDALAFLHHLMEMPVNEAVNRHQGWKSIRHRDLTSQPIEMGFQANFWSGKSAWDAEYSFSLNNGPQQQVQVVREKLRIRERAGGRDLGYSRVNGEVEWIGNPAQGEALFWGSQSPKHALASLLRPDRLVLSVTGTQPFLDLSLCLQDAEVYNFVPAVMRDHQPTATWVKLLPDGRNLARAIEGIREAEPETSERIRQYLETIVPGTIGFKSITYGDRETVQFNLETGGTFDASSMSDGTLRVLATLIAVNQIILPRGFPGFVGIEEPETALHPAAIHALVAALDEATLRTQVLIATHSPELLDAPEVKPENLRFVESRDGATRITALDDASVEIIRQQLGTLGELQRLQQLELNRTDLQRQERERP